MSFFNADTLISGKDGLIFKDLGEIATTPSSGYGCIYVNADVLYFRTDGGTSTNLLAGGGGTPGGSDNQVQFNNSSSFGGSSNLTWDDTNLILASGKGIVFADTGEKISGDGSNITIASGRSILLTATSNIVLPSSVPLSFATDDAEKITGDGTDLTINSGRHINLTCASGDVIIPANIGLVLDGSGNEKIESDGTDISFSVGSGGDINIPSDIGLTFGHASAQKIEGDGSNITVSSGRSILLSATSNVIVSADMEVSGTLFSSVSTGRQEGFDSGSGTDPFTVYITKIGTDIITSIIIDLVGLGAKDGDGMTKYIIGDSGQTSAHILKFTNADHGYLYKAELFCFQIIGLDSGDNGDKIGISYHSSTQAGFASISDELIQASTSLTLGINNANMSGQALPNLNNKYIYIHLKENLDSGDSTYSTGKIRIQFYGYNDSI